MHTKIIYFSGGSFYELQEVFSRVKGVLDTNIGYINSVVNEPSYADVIENKTGAVMGVRVAYDPKKIDLSTLMDVLFAVINPYIKDRQGKAEGNMYRSGVYYCDDEDVVIIDFYMNFLRTKHKSHAAVCANVTVNDSCTDHKATYKCYAESMPLKNFYPAEEKHQYYLRKNPETETFIDFTRLKELNIII